MPRILAQCKLYKKRLSSSYIDEKNIGLDSCYPIKTEYYKYIHKHMFHEDTKIVDTIYPNNVCIFERPCVNINIYGNKL